MKKNISKKQMFLTILFFVLFLSIPRIDVKAEEVESWVIATDQASVGTGNTGGETEVGNYTFSTDTSSIIRGFDKFYAGVNGKSELKMILAHTQGDYDDLVKSGKYSGIPIFMGTTLTNGNLTVEVPVGSIDADDQVAADEWEKFYENAAVDFPKPEGNNKTVINEDNIGYKIGVILGVYTGNSDDDTESLINGQKANWRVEKGAILNVHGTLIEVTASNADSIPECSVVQSYCNAIKKSYGKFSDDGYETVFEEPEPTCTERMYDELCPNCSPTEITKDMRKKVNVTCCVEQYGDESTKPGGECCMLYHNNYSYCNPDSEPEPKPETGPELKECKYEPDEPIMIQKKELKENKSTPATCGDVYTNTTYTYDTNECLLVFETQTLTTISLSEPTQTTYYAGSTFNWRPISSSQTTITKLYDASSLVNKVSNLETEINNREKLIAYQNCEIDNISTQLSYISGNLRNAEEECGEIDDESEKKECEETVKKFNEEKNKEIEKLSGKMGELHSSIASIEHDRKYLNMQDELEKYQECFRNFNSYKGKVSYSSNVASSGSETMILRDSSGTIFYTQGKGEIVALEKNSGNPLKKSDLKGDILANKKYLAISADFYIPNSITSSTKGELTRNVSFGNLSISYSCPFGATNNDNDNQIVGMPNIIYRPISLSNPFPNTNKGNSNYRVLGANWSETLAEKYIINNRNVYADNVYNLKPLYTIVLTPSTIKNIRNYNKNHGFNDFDMVCENGYNCMSNFLWQTFDGIVNESNSCASSNGLDMSCYNGGVSE